MKEKWTIAYDNADNATGGQWYQVGPAKVWFPYGASEGERRHAEQAARLIAAAPELLEALKQCEILIANQAESLRGSGGNPGKVYAMNNTATLARAAIAKAEGGEG